MQERFNKKEVQPRSQTEVEETSSVVKQSWQGKLIWKKKRFTGVKLQPPKGVLEENGNMKDDKEGRVQILFLELSSSWQLQG